MTGTPVPTRGAFVGQRGNSRLESLTALRFIAVLLVFGNHIGDSFLDQGSWLNDVAQTGFIGVSFFFMLSGFVLTWSRQPSDAPMRFYRRRFARIVPTYLVALLVALVLAVIAASDVSARGLVLSGLMVQSWDSDPRIHFGVNPVGWSLAVEAFFYLVFPWVIPFLTRLSVRARRAGMVLSMLFTVVWAIVGQVVEPGGRPWIVYVFPIARLPEFVLGILIALELRSGSLRRVPVGFSLGAVAIAWLVGLAVPPAFLVASLTLLPFALVIVAAAQRDLSGQRTGPLGGQFLVHLGMWSFSFYLVHELVIRYATDAFDLDQLDTGLQVVSVFALLLASIGASWALFRVVEEPSERWLRGASR